MHPILHANPNPDSNPNPNSNPNPYHHRYAQTVFLVDPRDAAGRKALYKLPTLGTPTDYHVVMDLAGQARECIDDGDAGLLLHNIREIMSMLDATDDSTRRKLASSLDTFTALTSDVLATLSDTIASCGGKFVLPAGSDTGPHAPQVVEEFLNGYIASCGPDAAAIAAKINSEIAGKLD